MLHPTSLLPVLALAATAVAQVGWTQCNPATRPPARGHHSLTFDIVRGVTVLFGGDAGGPLTNVPLDDTWEWNGVNWTQRIMPVSPSPRFDHALAYDIGRGRVVLFGGATANIGGDKNDTWEFDGNIWTHSPTANQPSQRRLASMVHDVARGRIVLFGGGDFGTLHNDTWEWDGVAWTMRSPSTSPAPRWASGMAYDLVRSRIVLFGGYAGGTTNAGDTWTWDGTTWSQVFAGASTGNTGLGLCYDAARDLVVRFHGTTTSADTWLFDHVAWRRDPRTATPQGRYWFSLAHDLVRSRTVLFGGTPAGPNFDDTWEYDPGTIARWTTSGSGCQGSAGVPMLRPVGASLPIFGTTFQLELLASASTGAAISFGFSNTQWNGGPLPWDLGAFGMTGCTLYASPDVMYFRPAVGGYAMLQWPLPNAASLIGVQFFNQGFVLDPGVNPLGATVSNAGAAIIGPF